MGNDLSCPGQICVSAWGCSEGEKWIYKSKVAISEIIIRHIPVIHTIQFKSQESSDHSASFGGIGNFDGGPVSTVKLDFPSEFLTGISGTSLYLHTNRSLYGPFGSHRKGTPFSFITKDGMITGFHGWAGQYLNAIGVYIVPSKDVAKQRSEYGCRGVQNLLFITPRSAAPWGGDGGRDWDDGVFSSVKEVHVLLRADSGVLCAVRFTYQKEDGSDFLSPQHGCSCGVSTHTKTVVFGEDGEFLIGIEGLYGKVEGSKVIRSLTFMTNKGKYGPFGDEIGTYFCSVNFMDCKRKVVGFHGRSGAYLDAIGLHTQYLDN